MKLRSNGKPAIICASIKGLDTAEEVADVIAVAASPGAQWINGRNTPVEGLEQPYPPLIHRPF